MTAYDDGRVSVHLGDCLDVLRSLPDASVDSVVTDPPYLLGFMGREWDTKAGHEHLDWHRAWCDEAYRVLKPGGHMLAFGGTRTWHRLACAVEDAGFEVRDSIAWLYGSGFSKSWNFKTMYKGEWCSCTTANEPEALPGSHESLDDGALRDGAVCPRCGGLDPFYQGAGTGLKPAFEPVVVARKPLQGTVAANVLAHGTGALNVDGCRVGTGEKIQTAAGSTSGAWIGPVVASEYEHGTGREYRTGGRWPANVVLDESQAQALDEQSGTLTSDKFREAYGDFKGQEECTPSRFFYVAKAPKRERPRSEDGTAHPTVKPLDLMRWLVRLVTPPGGLVLDPFAGSGTTVEACIVEGFHCLAIEREPDYLPLILQRINRQRDPLEHTRTTGGDLALFELEGEPA